MTPASGPAVIIGRTPAHAAEMAGLLESQGWSVAGLYGWDASTLDGAAVGPGQLDRPIDESDLFAGRHHGNMQDSRDYLAWEEELPDQIDSSLHDLWQKQLAAIF